MKKTILLSSILLISLILSGTGICSDQPGLSKGQKVYVPAYSHIYSGNRQVPSLLTVTLSIRNTDPAHAIKVETVDYFDTQGKLLKNHIELPVYLKPLETVNYVIPLDDKSGGAGANFIVTWTASGPVNQPIIETIMIGSRSSFTSRGQVIIPPK